MRTAIRIEPPALKPLLGLAAAAALVYAATARRAPDEATLNDVARMIAARTRLFARDGRDCVLVMPAEILEGEIEGGGTVLTFADGRPTLQGLCILHSELDALVEELRAVYRGTPSA